MEAAAAKPQLLDKRRACGGGACRAILGPSRLRSPGPAPYGGLGVRLEKVRNPSELFS